MKRCLRMVNKALLKDKDGLTIAVYEKDNTSYEVSTGGAIVRAFVWDEDGNPVETEFFAKLSVKWDGCSHFNFFGEDYHSGDKDSYYHICGVSNYIDFMRIMAFAYEIMVEHVGYDRIDEKEELENLRNLGLLKDYKIIYE